MLAYGVATGVVSNSIIVGVDEVDFGVIDELTCFWFSICCCFGTYLLQVASSQHFIQAVLTNYEQDEQLRYIVLCMPYS